MVQQPREIGVGLRDPSQLITFFESAFQAVDPTATATTRRASAALSKQLDLDVDKDVFAQLTGNLSVSASIDGRFGARAEVKDPDAFRAPSTRSPRRCPSSARGSAWRA